MRAPCAASIACSGLRVSSGACDVDSRRARWNDELGLIDHFHTNACISVTAKGCAAQIGQSHESLLRNAQTVPSRVVDHYVGELLGHGTVVVEDPCRGVGCELPLELGGLGSSAQEIHD